MTSTLRAFVHIVRIVDRCDFDAHLASAAFLSERNARQWMNDKIVQLVHEAEVAGRELDLFDPAGTITSLEVLG